MEHLLSGIVGVGMRERGEKRKRGRWGGEVETKMYATIIISNHLPFAFSSFSRIMYMRTKQIVV